MYSLLNNIKELREKIRNSKNKKFFFTNSFKLLNLYGNDELVKLNFSKEDEKEIYEDYLFIYNNIDKYIHYLPYSKDELLNFFDLFPETYYFKYLKLFDIHKVFGDIDIIEAITDKIEESIYGYFIKNIKNMETFEDFSVFYNEFLSDLNFLSVPNFIEYIKRNNSLTIKDLIKFTNFGYKHISYEKNISNFFINLFTKSENLMEIIKYVISSYSEQNQILTEIKEYFVDKKNLNNKEKSDFIIKEKIKYMNKNGIKKQDLLEMINLTENMTNSKEFDSDFFGINLIVFYLYYYTQNFSIEKRKKFVGEIKSILDNENIKIQKDDYFIKMFLELNDSYCFYFIKNFENISHIIKKYKEKKTFFPIKNEKKREIFTFFTELIEKDFISDKIKEEDYELLLNISEMLQKNNKKFVVYKFSDNISLSFLPNIDNVNIEEDFDVFFNTFGNSLFRGFLDYTNEKNTNIYLKFAKNILNITIDYFKYKEFHEISENLMTYDFFSIFYSYIFKDLFVGQNFYNYSKDINFDNVCDDSYKKIFSLFVCNSDNFMQKINLYSNELKKVGTNKNFLYNVFLFILTKKEIDFDFSNQSIKNNIKDVMQFLQKNSAVYHPIIYEYLFFLVKTEIISSLKNENMDFDYDNILEQLKEKFKESYKQEFENKNLNILYFNNLFTDYENNYSIFKDNVFDERKKIIKNKNNYKLLMKLGFFEFFHHFNGLSENYTFKHEYYYKTFVLNYMLQFLEEAKNKEEIKETFKFFIDNSFLFNRYYNFKKEIPSFLKDINESVKIKLKNIKEILNKKINEKERKELINYGIKTVYDNIISLKIYQSNPVLLKEIIKNNFKTVVKNEEGIFDFSPVNDENIKKIVSKKEDKIFEEIAVSNYVFINKLKKNLGKIFNINSIRKEIDKNL